MDKFVILLGFIMITVVLANFSSMSRISVIEQDGKKFKESISMENLEENIPDQGKSSNIFNENDVELQLWINESMVASKVADSLHVGSIQNISHILTILIYFM